MKLRIARVPRRPNWPLWAVLLVAGWICLVAVATWLSARSGQDVTLCAFKTLTGRPCATCGSTRGALALLHGHVLAAFTFNPLVFGFAVIGGLLLAMRLTLGRTLQLELTRAERWIARALFALIFAANWAYVIAYVG